MAVGFGGFPSATSGSFPNTFDLTQTSVYSAATAAPLPARKPPWLAGSAVAVPNVNIHHATFVGGEIRSQLTPEPRP